MRKIATMGIVLLASAIFSGFSTPTEVSANKADIRAAKASRRNSEEMRKRDIRFKKADSYLSTGFGRIGSNGIYKTPKDVKKVVGSYFYQKDDDSKSFITINKDGTYTMFSYYTKVDQDYDLIKDFYADKNGTIQKAAKMNGTALESGVVFEKYGKIYLNTIDGLKNPYSYNEKGKYSKMVNVDLLDSKKLIEDSPGSNADIGDTIKNDFVTKDGTSLKLTRPQLDVSYDTTNLTNLYNYYDEDGLYQSGQINEGSVSVDGKPRIFEFEKLKKTPTETSKSVRQYLLSLKNIKKFTNLNEFFQYSKKGYSDYCNYDIKYLKDGYTSSNKNPKIKLAYANLDVNSNNDEKTYYITATDGSKIYSAKTKSSTGKVSKWHKYSD